MVSLSRIVTKLLLRGERASTLIFFLVSAGLELLCFLLHLLVRRSRFVRHHTVRPRDGRAGPRGYRVHHDVAAGDVCFVSPAGAPGLLLSRVDPGLGGGGRVARGGGRPLAGGAGRAGRSQGADPARLPWASEPGRPPWISETPRGSGRRAGKGRGLGPLPGPGVPEEAPQG